MSVKERHGANSRAVPLSRFFATPVCTTIPITGRSAEWIDMEVLRRKLSRTRAALLWSCLIEGEDCPAAKYFRRRIRSLLLQMRLAGVSE